MSEFFSTFNTFIDTIILIGGGSVFFAFLIYWHSDKSTRFDIRDLLIDSKTKELSLYKVGQLLALIISTWVLVHETRAGKLSEWLFGLYMIAWSGINMVNKYLTKSDKSDQSETK
jgi:hypothetical protein